jgi:hypothetical protein
MPARTENPRTWTQATRLRSRPTAFLSYRFGGNQVRAWVPAANLPTGRARRPVSFEAAARRASLRDPIDPIALGARPGPAPDVPEAIPARRVRPGNPEGPPEVSKQLEGATKEASPALLRAHGARDFPRERAGGARAVKWEGKGPRPGRESDRHAPREDRTAHDHLAPRWKPSACLETG